MPAAEAAASCAAANCARCKPEAAMNEFIGTGGELDREKLARPLSRKPLITRRSNRWIQLLLGLLCMMAISSPQYIWALFTKPFTDSLEVRLAEVHVTFS